MPVRANMATRLLLCFSVFSVVTRIECGISFGGSVSHSPLSEITTIPEFQMPNTDHKPVLTIFKTPLAPGRDGIAAPKPLNKSIVVPQAIPKAPVPDTSRHAYPVDPKKLSGSNNTLPAELTTAPDQLYIHKYKQSNSRYGDLLAGLAFYNLERSQNHYQNHFYFDENYKTTHGPESSSTYIKTLDPAKCLLKIQENSKVEYFKIPCNIVSTFTEGSKKFAPNLGNKTLCNVLQEISSPGNGSSFNSTVTINSLPTVTTPQATTFLTTPTTTNMTVTTDASITNHIKATTSAFTINNATLTTDASETSNASTTTNATVITNIEMKTTTTNAATTTNTSVVDKPVKSCFPYLTMIDPLTVKGLPVNTDNMKCAVEIHTKTTIFKHDVDCNNLTQIYKVADVKNNSSDIDQSTMINSKLTELKNFFFNKDYFVKKNFQVAPVKLLTEAPVRNLPSESNSESWIQNQSPIILAVAAFIVSLVVCTVKTRKMIKDYNARIKNQRRT